MMIVDRSNRILSMLLGLCPCMLCASRIKIVDIDKFYRLECVLISRFIINLQELAVNYDRSSSEVDSGQTQTRTSRFSTIRFSGTVLGNIGAQLCDHDLDDDSTLGEEDEASHISVGGIKIRHDEAVELDELFAGRGQTGIPEEI